MSSVKYLKPNFSQDAFEGTALYYARYRIPYPQILIDDLIKRTNPPQQGTLLDLASGPGRVAIPLAPFFSKVIANDVDSEMVATGKSEVVKRGVNNIEWLIGRAEELIRESNSVELITIGEAFHRLDQSLVLDLANKWLKPGGYVAIIGMFNIWGGNEVWQMTAKEIVNKWAPHHTVLTNYRPQDYGLILKDKGFIECGSYSFEFPHYCTIDSIIGYLYSTSRCSKKVLRNNTTEFESELKAELSKINKKGVFFENVRCGYTIGKKTL